MTEEFSPEEAGHTQGLPENPFGEYSYQNGLPQASPEASAHNLFTTSPKISTDNSSDAMGTFKVTKRDEGGLPYQTTKNPFPVGMELRSKREQSEERDLLELGKAAKKLGLELEQKDDGSTTIFIPSEEIERLTREDRERHLAHMVFAVRLGEHQHRWKILRKKMNEIEDPNERTSLYGKIEAAFNSLGWLSKSLETETSDDDVKKQLFALGKLLQEFEEAINRAEKEREEGEETFNPDGVSSLVKGFEDAETAIQEIRSGLGDDFNDHRFHADVVMELLEGATVAKGEFEGERSAENYGAFRAAVEALTHGVKGMRSALEEYRQEQQAKQEKGIPELTDVWHIDWPFRGRAGAWLSGEKKLDNQAEWSKLKTNFDVEMRAYSNFLRDDEPGGFAKKATMCVALVRAKNRMLEAIAGLDIRAAFEALGVFREEIGKAQLTWENFKREEANKAVEQDREASERKEQIEIFNGITKEYDESIVLKNSIFDLIGSAAEQLFITNLVEEIDKQKRQIEEGIGSGTNIQGLLEDYKKSIERLRTILAGSKDHIKATFSGIGAANTVLRAGKPAITYGQWRNAHAQELKDRESSDGAEKIRAKEQLLKIHRDNFYANKEKFKELYLKKSWGKDDPNREAVRAVFVEYIDHLDRNIHLKRLEISDLEVDLIMYDADQAITRIRLDEANKELEKLEDEILEFGKEIYLNETWPTESLVGTDEGGHEEYLKRRVQMIFDERVRKLEEAISEKKREINEIEYDLTWDAAGPDEKHKKETARDAAKQNLKNLEEELQDLERGRDRRARRDPNENTAPKYRETYSPASDSSIADIGHTYEDLDEEGRKAFDMAQKRNSKKQEETARSEARMSVEDIVEKRKKETPLNDKTNPNHYDGMTLSLSEEDIQRDGVHHAEPVAPHAVPSKEVASDISREQLLKKQKAVDSLLGTRLKRLKRWQLIAFAIVGAAVAYQGGAYVAKQITRPTTINDVVSWRDFFEGSESGVLQNKYDRFVMKDFINTLVSPNTTFESFIKTYSPRSNLDHGNPGTLQRVSIMYVTNLLKDPAMPGVSADERKDLCDIIKALEQIMAASQPGKRTFSSINGNEYFPNDAETLETLFNRARNAATTADSQEKKN